MNNKMVDWEQKLDNVIRMCENNAIELVQSWKPFDYNIY
jgi:hypothetical protein